MFPMSPGAHPCVKGLRPRSNQMSFLAGPFQTKLFHSNKDNHQTSIRACSILARDHGNQPCIDLVYFAEWLPPLAHRFHEALPHGTEEVYRCKDTSSRSLHQSPSKCTNKVGNTTTIQQQSTIDQTMFAPKVRRMFAFQRLKKNGDTGSGSIKLKK